MRVLVLGWNRTRCPTKSGSISSSTLLSVSFMMPNGETAPGYKSSSSANSSAEANDRCDELTCLAITLVSARLSSCSKTKIKRSLALVVSKILLHPTPLSCCWTALASSTVKTAGCSISSYLISSSFNRCSTVLAAATSSLICSPPMWL